jgi:hypothetical protein
MQYIVEEGSPERVVMPRSGDMLDDHRQALTA